jgi:uroporphyrinogen-III synthase
MRDEQKILLIRPRQQAEDYAQELGELGYSSIIEPVLDIRDTAGEWPVFSSFQAIVVTSVHAVHALVKATDERDMPVYVVGPNSLEVARRYGFSRLVAGKGKAKDLVKLISNVCVPASGSVLYIRAKDVAFDLQAALSKSGFTVHEHIAYEAVPVTALSLSCQDAICGGEVQAVPFFSKRSADIFFTCIEEAKLTRFLDGIKALCISESVLEYVRLKFGGEAYVSESPDRSGITKLITTHCQAREVSKEMERDNMSSKPSKKPIENGAEIIERFGGIRPLAKKIDVAVTTVQGWKKRDTIPATRRQVIIEAAETYDVDLTDLMNDAPEVQPAANENSAKPAAVEKADTQASKPETVTSVPPVKSRPSTPLDEETLDEKLAAVEEKVVGRNTIIVIGLIALLLLAFAALLWPKPRDEATLDRLSALEARTQELQGEVAEVQDNVDEQQSFFGTMIPENLDEQVANLGQRASETASNAVTSAQQMSADIMEDETFQAGLTALETQLEEITGRPVLAGMFGNVQQMSSNPEGQATLDQAMSQLNVLMASMTSDAVEDSGENETSLFESTLNAARGQSDALGQTFEDVPASELKAAALLLTMQQFRSSLNRDNEAFQDDFEVLMGLVAEENIELRAALEKLAPHAEEGVLTPAGLTNEFKTIAGDAVVASLKGEDVSLQDRASARFNEVLQIEKDGELITGTETQAKVNTAETLLENGEIEQAISIVESLDGPAAQALSGWLRKAKATLNAQSLDQTLTKNINLRAFGVEDITTLMSGEGLPGGGQLIRDQNTGINIYRPNAFPKGSSGDRNAVGNANPYD